MYKFWVFLNFLLPEIFSFVETFDEWFHIFRENDKQEVVQQLHKISFNLFLSLSDYCDNMIHNNDVKNNQFFFEKIFSTLFNEIYVFIYKKNIKGLLNSHF